MTEASRSEVPGAQEVREEDAFDVASVQSWLRGQGDTWARAAVAATFPPRVEMLATLAAGIASTKLAPPSTATKPW